MAFYNKAGSMLRQSISASSSLSGQAFMYNTIRCTPSKLFIGDLSYGTDENSLRNAFSCFGDIVEATVVSHRDTGRSKGFGFVNYSNGDSANLALSRMDGKELDGRKISVSYAIDRELYGGFGNRGWKERY